MKRKCDKRGFVTKGDAVTAAEALRRKPLVFFVRVYRCGSCKKFHVTTKHRPVGKRKRVQR